MSLEKTFLKESEQKAFDIKRRHQVSQDINRYEQTLQKSLHQYKDYDLAKSRAAYIKTASLENMAHYLLEFEEKFQNRGGQVRWAESIQEAQEAILHIISEIHAKSIILSQSNTLSEIKIKAHLEENSLRVSESAIKQFVYPEEPSLAAPSTQAHIKMLREKMFELCEQSDVVITGANFLIADAGAVALTENEGNIRLSTAFAKVHIVVAGLEKILPRLQDVDLFWPLLASSAQGQNLGVYNSIFMGPRQSGEVDGPEAMYVILLDNERTKVLADTQIRQALNCIQCGACHKVCPVYAHIGEEIYKSHTTGPIGAVLSPHYEGFKKFKHLSFASTLCGACAQVCPVKIDLPRLLLLNREQAVQKGQSPRQERSLVWFWQRIMGKRSRLNQSNLYFKKYFLRRFFKKSWGKRRELPELAKKTFNQLWRQKQNEK